jgi:hypothetical protein
MILAALGAAILLTVGLLLLSGGKRRRAEKGLTDARTLDLDGVTLYSKRLGLSVRSDRVIDEGGVPVPEEWKSARRVYDDRRAQMGVYFLLIEEQVGIRPPHGYISLGTGERVKVENTDELGAGHRRPDPGGAARTGPRGRGQQPPGMCPACGMREVCGRRSG